jgi:hypothetical protein
MFSDGSEPNSCGKNLHGWPDPDAAGHRVTPGSHLALPGRPVVTSANIGGALVV